MKRLEDFADDPLVPALLQKVHEVGDKKLMDVRLISFLCRLALFPCLYPL